MDGMIDIKSEPDDEQATCVIKLEQHFDPPLQKSVPPRVTSMETPAVSPKVLLKSEHNSSFISQEAVEDVQNVQIKTEPLCDLNIELKSEPVELKMEPNHASFDCLSQELGSTLLLDHTLFPMLFDFEPDHMLCKGVFPVMENEPEIVPVSIDLVPPKTSRTQDCISPSKQTENPVFVEKTEFDIICGRGTRSNVHNQYFRDHMVGPCRDEYRGYSKNQRQLKRAIIDRLISWVMDRGGRFLELHKVHKKWYEITLKEAIIKLQKMVNEHKSPGEPTAKAKRKKNIKK